ncbi:uncharacterized protein EV420DRAFT_842870 [Desarmillaria tabescens]|uniref:Uncharacterized protein n=1 Tax=Armillaria tabescens TaxID=1929756 RepID=A0AA39JXI7_ARMTA|nr:uncharacterized protein EV420DRAFT_842870 [Desarmillaria tabescens]KAK0448438.1 hypothetical protein EV420DRAFT_842870 [Desarmillaria tabescens]
MTSDLSLSSSSVPCRQMALPIADLTVLFTPSAALAMASTLIPGLISDSHQLVLVGDDHDVTSNLIHGRAANVAYGSSLDGRKQRVLFVIGNIYRRRRDISDGYGQSIAESAGEEYGAYIRLSCNEKAGDHLAARIKMLLGECYLDWLDLCRLASKKASVSRRLDPAHFRSLTERGLSP